MFELEKRKSRESFLYHTKRESDLISNMLYAGDETIIRCSCESCDPTGGGRLERTEEQKSPTESRRVRLQVRCPRHRK